MQLQCTGSQPTCKGDTGISLMGFFPPLSLHSSTGQGHTGEQLPGISETKIKGRGPATNSEVKPPWCIACTATLNFLGEDLGHLGTKELEQLEHQLDKSLKQIRSTKIACKRK
ncbi:hypothetical protein CK203_094617 [Vitis vinifera]|uniref:K-box domain-containing protein n=1 Tax=Vitis vinifera TaxID=29760 RepID=A0A438E358_VITVI|nr:hypothetical protein CK203_094617 [Vitis vinifera]